MEKRHKIRGCLLQYVRMTLSHKGKFITEVHTSSQKEKLKYEVHSNDTFKNGVTSI